MLGKIRIEQIQLEIRDVGKWLALGARKGKMLLQPCCQSGVHVRVCTVYIFAHPITLRCMSEPYIVPPCHQSVDILYADDHLMFVHKPHLLLSIPGRHPANRDCVITRLRQTHPTASIVHRLDLDTSGIMVIPLRREVHSHISRQFQERRVEKAYHAVVFGELPHEAGEIDLPIAPDWANRPRQKICGERGKPALTRYEVVARAPGRTRLLLRPETGRSHQLRIHLAEIGYPILGCDLYAHETALAASSRLLLHASYLGFEHPASGDWIEQKCPAEF
jgi:tRNA pseudouridine32 synthase/23S rRNA pseudouridine746 synthase